MPTETHMLQTMFASRTAAGADASRIAAMAVAIWEEVDIALSPIIGHAGVAALFQRSIHLTCREHPCLADGLKAKTQADAISTVQATLAQQTSAAAVSANLALLQSFHDLLTSLIGLSLTDRLLRPVWDKPSSGQAEQDTVS